MHYDRELTGFNCLLGNALAWTLNFTTGYVDLCAWYSEMHPVRILSFHKKVIIQSPD